MPSVPSLHAAATARLAKSCPSMKALIARVGPCTMEIETARSPFQALVSAVAHQQLHGKAAATILGRFRKLFPGGRFPGPKALASVSDEQLRGVGFSRAKTAALRVDDYGVRTGWKLTDRLPEMPSPKELQALGERFRPHRSIAAWYFWRATDVNRSPQGE